MPSYHTTRQLAFSPPQLFDLVADVESYPHFVPFCQSLKILEKTIEEENYSAILAQMCVGYQAIREKFVTKVHLFPKEKKVRVEYIDGPFKHLENKWHFQEEGSSGAPCTLVDFHIEYEFRNVLTQWLVGAAFDTAVRACMEAFERRAYTIYSTSAMELPA